MTDKLLEQRGELESAYSEANDALQDARIVASKAADAVRAFDIEHPEVMIAVKDALNERRKVESPAALQKGITDDS